jgi:hypothetical protein
MGANTGRSELEVSDRINQKPVRLYMAFSKISPLPFELMILELRGQRFWKSERFKDIP